MRDPCRQPKFRYNSPSSPHSMYTRTLRYIDNVVHIGVVVVVGSSWHLNETIRHSDIFRIDAQIFRCSHNRKFYLTVRAERLV